MLNQRIIPVLLLCEGGLVKTRKFSEPVYVGDPINAVKIFNDKEVDELCFVDITATIRKQEPDYKIISQIAGECFMPLSCGGGINSFEHAKKLFKLGVEKVVISSAAHQPGLIKKITDHFGSQSVVGCMDIKKNFFGKYEVYINSGKKGTGKNPVAFAAELQEMGAGEIMINSIDRDGTMQGYDLNIISQVVHHTDLPVIACGGAAGLDDIAKVIRQSKVSAAAAGSMFVFHGKHRAVLISYPSRDKISEILPAG